MFRSLIALAFLAVPSVMAVAAGKGSNLYCFKPIKDVSNPAYAWEVDFDKTEDVCRTLSSGSTVPSIYNTCRVATYDTKWFKERCEDDQVHKAGYTTDPTWLWTE